MNPPSALRDQKAMASTFPGASTVPVLPVPAALSAAFVAELSAAFVPVGLPRGSQFKRQFKHLGTPVGGSMSKVKWWVLANAQPHRVFQVEDEESSCLHSWWTTFEPDTLTHLGGSAGRFPIRGVTPGARGSFQCLRGLCFVLCGGWMEAAASVCLPRLFAVLEDEVGVPPPR